MLGNGIIGLIIRVMVLVWLRKYLDESYNGEPKPAWYVYQKANTHEEDEFFEQFLPIIGISDWNIIENF